MTAIIERLLIALTGNLITIALIMLFAGYIFILLFIYFQINTWVFGAILFLAGLIAFVFINALNYANRQRE